MNFFNYLFENLQFLGLICAIYLFFSYLIGILVAIFSRSGSKKISEEVEEIKNRINSHEFSFKMFEEKFLQRQNFNNFQISLEKRMTNLENKLNQEAIND